MATMKTRVDDSHGALMMAIGDTIARYTTTTPMKIEGIVGVLAFCAGAAIMRDPNTSWTTRRQLKEMAEANIEFGMDAMRQSTTSLILPGDLN